MVGPADIDQLAAANMVTLCMEANPYTVRGLCGGGQSWLSVILGRSDLVFKLVFKAKFPF